MKKKGTVFFTLNINKTITKKPLGTRIGKGKGSVESQCQLLKPGSVVCYINNITINKYIKRELIIIQKKLPFKSILFIKKKFIQFL